MSLYKIAGFKSLTRTILGHDVDRLGFNIPPILGLIGLTFVVGAAGFASQTGLFDFLNNLISKLRYINYLCKRGKYCYNIFFEFIIFMFLFLDPTTTTTTAAPIIQSKYPITTLVEHKG